MKVQWQRHDPVDVPDLATLDALLDDLHHRAVNTGRLVAVSLYHHDPGPVLTITVGADHAVAQWSDLGGNQEATSLAPNPRTAADIAIDYGGQSSTLPSRHFVAAESVRMAARTFFTTLQRPPEISWPDAP